MMRLFTVVVFFTLSLAACTVYKSTAREAIEKNTDGILGTMNFGLNVTSQLSYFCSRSAETPSFLKEPLEVLDTPLAQENITVLSDPYTELNWVIVYQHNSKLNCHEYCKIYFLKSPPYSHENLLSAAKEGFERLREMSNQLQQ
ncbi:MAG: hypothetical protein A2Z20_07040 [Bdellovibrionales bacterium RBG_16_40_8]|nr:MAG: hypothetical protein A2Z20_07040 [Bdellovibrionales bacterium RBG_16_40_8]